MPCTHIASGNDDILDDYVMDETNHMNDHEIFKDDEAHIQNM
jgi:hypothetical protein